jgi:hypothetical protein
LLRLRTQSRWDRDEGPGPAWSSSRILGMHIGTGGGMLKRQPIRV